MHRNKAYKTQRGKDEILKYYDMLLQELTIPHEKLSIITRHGNTFYIAAGDISAQPMVLLHGSSMNSCMWISDIKKFHKKYRVYAFDIPGEAGKSDENQLPFTSSDYDDWLYDVYKELSIDKAIIIGASLGAWLAVKFAAKYPDRVDKLVLISPAGIGSQNKKFLYVALFHMLFGEKGLRKLFKMINGNGDLPEIVLNYQILIGKHFNTRKEPIPSFTDDEIRRLTMPIFLFVGAKDILLNSKETAERLQSLVPDAKINYLNEGGHSLINMTDEIARQIQ